MRAVLVLLMFLVIAFAGCFGGDDGGDGSGDSTDGGDGTRDSTGDGPTDADGDGVADDQDVCDGHDDNVDSDGDGTPDGCDDTPQGGEDPGPKRDAETWDISISGIAFVDGSITIQVGDTVRWTHNDGNIPHSVTSDDDSSEEFDSNPMCVPPTPVGCMADGDTFEHTFDTAGEFGYHCSVHGDDMTGTITVLDRYDPTPS